jgi:SNF2 family DNA or RNA helicase
MEEMFIAQYNNITATALNKITVLIRLQQISSGFVTQRNAEIEADADVPDMYMDEDYDVRGSQVEWIGKSNPKLDALYGDVDEAQKPLIIVTHFSCEAERIYDDLHKKYKCCLMTGWKKIGTIEEFQQGKYEIMVANVRVISRGFNLQNSHVMLFYSNTFSLEDRLQVEGRIFRIGQQEVCEYVDYVFEDSVDEKVVTALTQKKKLLDYIRGADIKEIL